ncbi:unnamed protein product [Bursaphelenchus okinawaensis]|uniref:Saposin B-type domain-containing protein n=1 Tax=Bursaphelenchus okinawaensis TaxID=465554 RepID=A0A811L258_9BILA|nr:unnamed protein product [Bursaphelenchus okinawaensis]CAG9114851.1 unnamed protein product [Bursaphelenchus okinawaensis]
MWQVNVFVFAIVSIICYSSIVEKHKDFCTGCQKVLDNSFVNYQAVTSRRVLRHKLKHLCKRYFEYRRRCLAILPPNFHVIADHMDSAMLLGIYKPLDTCTNLKECNVGAKQINAAKYF